MLDDKSRHQGIGDDECTPVKWLAHKVPQRRVYLEMNRMKRGKPHKRETQILVGEIVAKK